MTWRPIRHKDLGRAAMAFGLIPPHETKGNMLGSLSQLKEDAMAAGRLRRVDRGRYEVKVEEEPMR